MFSLTWSPGGDTIINKVFNWGFWIGLIFFVAFLLNDFNIIHFYNSGSSFSLGSFPINLNGIIHNEAIMNGFWVLVIVGFTIWAVTSGNKKVPKDDEEDNGKGNGGGSGDGTS